MPARRTFEGAEIKLCISKGIHLQDEQTLNFAGVCGCLPPLLAFVALQAVYDCQFLLNFRLNIRYLCMPDPYGQKDADPNSPVAGFGSSLMV